MAVQFILGRSGAGKTDLCIRSIAQSLRKNNSPIPLILLVPEQATYQAERAILAQQNITGYSRLHVLSFDRLRFLLLKSGAAHDEISRIGREMLVNKVLMESRDKLKLLAGPAQTVGLAAELTNLIIELHQAAKDAEDLDTLTHTLQKDLPDTITAAKFHDLALIYRLYINQIESKFINPDIQLTKACRKVPDATLLRKAKIWIDGFASFTIQQTQMLAELLKVASDTSIALCLDPDLIDVKNPDPQKLDPLSLFSPTEKTYAELVGIVRKLKLPIKAPVVLKQPIRFSHSADLRHIERHLFDALKPKPVKSDGSIQITPAPNRRTEVIVVARKILHLVRNHQYRFRDIAVIVADLQSYQHYIEAIFTDYRISFFIDRPRPLDQHPIVELITSALQVIINDYSFSDVFAYLKSGLAPIDIDEVDLLENYCLAFGVDHSDFRTETGWSFVTPDDQQFDQDKINRIRQKALRPLQRLKEYLCTNSPDNLLTPAQFTKALWNFLDELNVHQKLCQWAESDPADTLGHRQFYDKLVKIFDELIEIFPAESVPLARYASILSAAFSKLTLKLIPPTLDEVLVGSIERSRHPDLKAVFLLGVTQKQFPQPLSFDSILSDEDRCLAYDNNFVLSDTLQQHLLRRQYLAYIAFTRPSQRLYISYPLTDGDGTKVEPSTFLNSIHSLFLNLEDTYVTDPSDPADIYTAAELAEIFCKKLAEDGPADQADSHQHLQLLKKLQAAPEPVLVNLAGQITEALDYDNQATLRPELTKDFFPEILDCSPSRLQTFASCPYRHFASYMLQLQQRKIFRLEPVDLGTFYHHLLDGLFKRLKKIKKDFASADDDLLKKFCSEQIAELVTNDSFISNFVRRCAFNEYIIASAADTFTDTALALAQMSRAGSFRQIASELRFGFDRDSKFLLTTPAGHKINLRGCIDRIDSAEINGKKVAVVFDYKKTQTHLSFSEFYHGLDLQLALYLMALSQIKIQNEKIDSPAGAFYIPIETPGEKASLDELETRSEKFTHKAKGILDGDFAKQLDGTVESNWSDYYNFQVLKKEQTPYGSYKTSGALRPEHFRMVLNFTENKIIQLAEKILQGQIRITPARLNKKSPCSYCIYSALCKFDWQINRYNLLPQIYKTDALLLMETENAR
jgi:ATP-dependent helicase/nuclease subunit B